MGTSGSALPSEQILSLCNRLKVQSSAADDQEGSPSKRQRLRPQTDICNPSHAGTSNGHSMSQSVHTPPSEPASSSMTPITSHPPTLRPRQAVGTQPAVGSSAAPAPGPFTLFNAPCPVGSPVLGILTAGNLPASSPGRPAAPDPIAAFPGFYPPRNGAPSGALPAESQAPLPLHAAASYVTNSTLGPFTWFLPPILGAPSTNPHVGPQPSTFGAPSTIPPVGSQPAMPTTQPVCTGPHDAGLGAARNIPLQVPPEATEAQVGAVTGPTPMPVSGTGHGEAAQGRNTVDKLCRRAAPGDLKLSFDGFVCALFDVIFWEERNLGPELSIAELLAQLRDDSSED